MYSYKQVINRFSIQFYIKGILRGGNFKKLKNNFGDGTNPEMPYIFTSGGRIKYKGDEIGAESLGQLDQYIGTLGYQRIKEKDKDYGVKYVWAKQ